MEKYIGKVLNDRYMITEVIGVGGMAYVFKAFDKVCNRVVAVKILKDEFMSDAQFRRRFTNESKAITMLSHGNIVDVYDVSLEGDALYIVMEYIDGITLKEYMEKKGALSSTETIYFVRQILKGLSHAHERGIVHRDIKPHNIILLKDGTIKITDFGIARLTKFDTQTISDMTIGSVHYISPEQASGDHTDERSDVYSVGIILYEMLTGRLPFEADTAVAVALKQVQAQPDLPTEVNSEIPQGLEDITLKAIMKDPAVRYQSAGAILADLTLFESDPTITFNYAAAPEAELPVTDDNSPTLFAGKLELEEEFEGEPVPVPLESLDEQIEEEPVTEATALVKFKRTWLPIIGGILTAFVLLAIFALCIIFQKELFGSNKVPCPNVVGMTLEEAKEKTNFSYVVESYAASDTYPAGQIITQDPSANADIKKKGEIKVVISSGPSTPGDSSGNKPSGDSGATNYAPDILGYSKADAIAKCKQQDIAYRIETKFDDVVPEGFVIATSPTPGMEIFENTTVIIYISKGPEKVEEEPEEIEEVIMVNLIDESLENAKRTLTNNKLEVGKITGMDDESITEWYVIAQSVAEGEMVKVGTKINLTVSSKKTDEEPGVDTTPDSTPDEPETEKVKVTFTYPWDKDTETKVNVVIKAGDTEVYKEEQVTVTNPGKDFSIEVDRPKNATITVFIDSNQVEFAESVVS